MVQKVWTSVTVSLAKVPLTWWWGGTARAPEKRAAAATAAIIKILAIEKLQIVSKAPPAYIYKQMT